MLSSFTTKLALKKAGIPSDILDFSEKKREPNKLRKNPPQPSDENDADSGWGSWMSIRSLPLTVQPWLTPPPAAATVGRLPGIGDKAPLDKSQKLRLGGGKRVLLVFLRCVGCACKLLSTHHIITPGLTWYSCSKDFYKSPHNGKPLWRRTNMYSRLPRLRAGNP